MIMLTVFLIKYFISSLSELARHFGCTALWQDCEAIVPVRQPDACGCQINKTPNEVRSFFHLAGLRSNRSLF
jgi:hypothetical protein